MASSSDTSITLLGQVRREPTDQDAWKRFVDRYGPIIRGWCRRWGLQNADAEDVAQEVLQRLVSRIREFEYDPARSFRAWLKTLTRNALSDLISSRKGQMLSADSRVNEFFASLAARDELTEQVLSAYDQELLETAMQRVELRVQQQTWKAFQLTAREGLSGAAAAARLQTKITVVYKAKSNVQKLIREEVQKLEQEDV